MRVVDVLADAADLLQKAGVTDYERDARTLLEFTLGKSRSELFLAAREVIEDDLILLYKTLISRRVQREPVAYIIGEKEFWSLPFTVTPDVLIPRPETEFLLEQVFSKTSQNNYSRGKIVDLCCGSGVIATVLAKETGKEVVAIDVSSKALEVSRLNLKRHKLLDKVQLLMGDLLEAINQEAVCSLIVTNPPYVSKLDVAGNLEPEVAEFEPHLALDGGERGMELIKKIRVQAENVLLPRGQLFMEFGAEQGDEVTKLFSSRIHGQSGFSKVEIIKDYAGRDRVLHAVKS